MLSNNDKGINKRYCSRREAGEPQIQLHPDGGDYYMGSQLIVGAESAKRRFSYLCGKYELDMPIMAYVGWLGSEPWDLKRLHDEHKPLDTRTALDYALEWAQNEIADKSNK